MKFYDRQGNTLEIEMYGTNGIEWSGDFYGNSGKLDFMSEMEKYDLYEKTGNSFFLDDLVVKVDDVEYCVEAALDWLTHNRDWSIDEGDNSDWWVRATLNGNPQIFDRDYADEA